VRRACRKLKFGCHIGQRTLAAVWRKRTEHEQSKEDRAGIVSIREERGNRVAERRRFGQIG
jgi:hypothetical protein